MNTLVGGIRELACDLPKRSQEPIIQSVRGGSSFTHENLRPGYTGLTYTLSDIFLIVIQPDKRKLSSLPRPTTLDGVQSLPSAINMSIPVLQRMRNGIDGDFVRLELPSTYAEPTEIPGDPEFKRSVCFARRFEVNESGLTQP